MPNGTGIATGFPQILSEATAVKAGPARPDPGRAAPHRPAAERAATARALAAHRPRAPRGPGAALRRALRRRRPAEPQTAPAARRPASPRASASCCRSCRPGGLEWAWDAGAALRRSSGPGGDEPAGPGSGPDGVLAADVVLVPALAVDTLGTRLGQGGGYYDARAAAARPRRPGDRGRARRTRCSTPPSSRCRPSRTTCRSTRSLTPLRLPAPARPRLTRASIRYELAARGDGQRARRPRRRTAARVNGHANVSPSAHASSWSA